MSPMVFNQPHMTAPGETAASLPPSADTFRPEYIDQAVAIMRGVEEQYPGLFRIACIYGERKDGFRREEQETVGSVARNLVELLRSEKIEKDSQLYHAIFTMAVFLGSKCTLIPAFGNPEGEEKGRSAKRTALKRHVQDSVKIALTPLAQLAQA